MVVSINAKTDIHVEPMTAAQRQAKYRERRKAEEQALLAKTCGFERMTPISSRLKSAGHAVNQRAPTMHPSVSPGNPTQPSGCLGPACHLRRRPLRGKPETDAIGPVQYPRGDVESFGAPKRGPRRRLRCANYVNFA